MNRRKLALAVKKVQGIKRRREGEKQGLVEQREERSSLGRETDEKVCVDKRSN